MALKSLRTDTLNRVSDINGLVHIESRTIASVSAESFNNVFSTTFDNYLIQSRLTHSAGDTGIKIRLRVSGSDNSTSNYQDLVLFFNSNTEIVRAIETGQTSGQYGNANTSACVTDYSIFSPFLATPTLMVAKENSPESFTAPRYLFRNSLHNVASSFTGFSIFPTSGTISGAVSIYAYAKA